MKTLSNIQFEEYKYSLKMSYEVESDTAILQDGNEIIGSYSVPDSWGFLEHSVFYDDEMMLLDKDHYDFLDIWLDTYAINSYNHFKNKS